jgi:hypothetical protein
MTTEVYALVELDLGGRHYAQGERLALPYETDEEIAEADRLVGMGLISPVPQDEPAPPKATAKK